MSDQPLKNNRHIIKKQVLDLTVPQQQDAAELEAAVKQLFHDVLLPRLEALLNEYDRPGVLLRLEKLVVDTGNIPKERLQQELVSRVLQQVNEQLAQAVVETTYATQSSSEASTATAVAHSRLELFAYFMKQGNLPYWYEQVLESSLGELYATLLQTEPTLLREYWKQHIKSGPHRLRLIHQFNSERVQDTLALITRGQGKDLAQQAAVLAKLHAQASAPDKPATEEAILQAVYGAALQALAEDKPLEPTYWLKYYFAVVAQLAGHTAGRWLHRYQEIIAAAPPAGQAGAQLARAIQQAAASRAGWAVPGTGREPGRGAVAKPPAGAEPHTGTAPAGEQGKAEGQVQTSGKDEAGGTAHPSESAAARDPFDEAANREVEPPDWETIKARYTKLAEQQQPQPDDTLKRTLLADDDGRDAKEGGGATGEIPAGRGTEPDSNPAPESAIGPEAQPQAALESDARAEMGSATESETGSAPRPGANEPSLKRLRPSPNWFEHMGQLEAQRRQQPKTTAHAEEGQGTPATADDQAEGVQPDAAKADAGTALAPEAVQGADARPKPGLKPGDPTEQEHEKTTDKQAAGNSEGLTAKSESKEKGPPPQSPTVQRRPLMPGQPTGTPGTPIPWWRKAEQEAPEEVFIDNAGLVLLWPFIGRFFSHIGLMKGSAFVNEAAQDRAVHLLQYMATMAEATEEHALALNKVLCGLPVTAPVSAGIAVTAEEQVAIDDLLQAAVQNWSALKNTSVAGLRQSFLARVGRLKRNDNGWTLNAEPKAWDMLLDTLPWPISIVKNSWMTETIYTEW